MNFSPILIIFCSNLLEKTTDAVIKAAKTGNFIMVCILFQFSLSLSLFVYFVTIFRLHKLGVCHFVAFTVFHIQKRIVFNVHSLTAFRFFQFCAHLWCILVAATRFAYAGIFAAVNRCNGSNCPTLCLQIWLQRHRKIFDIVCPKFNHQYGR